MSLSQQLNNDIILLIFYHLNGGYRISLRSALTISHVCAHWRTLAVNHCPEVWRVHALRIPKPKQLFELMKSGQLPEFNKEMVRRSQDLDLEFGRDEIMPYSTGIAGILEECGSKVGWLSLPRPTDYTLHRDTVHRVLQKCSAPRLKHLELFDFPDDPPSSIFGADLSSLVSLTLTRCWINIQDMGIGKNLRVLNVTRDSGGCVSIRPFPVHLAAWIPILHKTPNLTSLALEISYWNSGPAPDPRSSARISLPHLTHLDLSLRFTDLPHLHDYMTIPASCQIRIIVSQYDDNRFPPDSSSFSVSRWIQQLSAHHAVPTPHGYACA